VIGVRPARTADAAAIGAVHVAAWRSAYPAILPPGFLTNLSAARQAVNYDAAIRMGRGVFVAVASGRDLAVAGGPRVVGFATGGQARRTGLGEGEIETLYVLDDYRDHGVGRRLLRALAGSLRDEGCASAFVWVLRDNPARFFYAHLGGTLAAEEPITFAGAHLVQSAYRWDPIDRLLEATAPA